MLDLTWKLFCMTGSIDSYLLIRDMEREHTEPEPEQKYPEMQERTD